MEKKETKVQSVTEATKTEKVRRKITKAIAKIVFGGMAAMSMIPTAFAAETSPGQFATDMLWYCMVDNVWNMRHFWSSGCYKNDSGTGRRRYKST